MTAQLTKLGILPGARWSVVDAPPGFSFEESPDAAAEVPAGSPADVVVAFVHAAADIPTILHRYERAIFPAGALWIAWPRRAGGHQSDITENAVRDAALARSLVDVKVAAINEDWSGLKLVWRRSAR
ncbi:MAG: hypothetical protein QOK08_1428 [Actinomycetota bacterium]|jgi:hypothetical protein|nr:hypothetical protein [Actinomycetota bacterium]MDQ1563960.1 hypothetical protein [Actinomycetota bacterium]